MIHADPPPVDPVARAERELGSNSYLALRRVRCQYLSGTLTLVGRLPSYYLKQMAQTAVSHLDGVARIDNRIEVLPAPRRRA